LEITNINGNILDITEVTEARNYAGIPLVNGQTRLKGVGRLKISISGTAEITANDLKIIGN
jgi:hypothetical protein